MALREEEIERVGLAILEPQSVKIDGLIDRGVDSTDVDHEFAVDEHPYIVVTRESKEILLIGVVCELRVQFEREVEIAAVTRSEKGAIIVRGEETAEVSAEPVDNLIDTTGASKSCSSRS